MSKYPWSDVWADTGAILQFCEYCHRAKSMYCGECAHNQGKQATRHSPLVPLDNTLRHFICHWCIRLIRIARERGEA